MGRLADFRVRAAVTPVGRVIRLLRSRPFDLMTEEGRSNERYRRAAWSTVALFFSRFLSILAGLVTVPLTLSYLGAESYGMWMTVSSLVGMASFADMGIGNGLLNSASEALGRGDRESAQKLISSALYALGGIALAVGAVFALIWGRVDWPSVFNVSAAGAASDAGPTVAALVAVFLVSMPLGVVQRVRMALQEGFIDSIWSSVGSLLSLIALLVATKMHAGLPILAVALAGAPLVAAVGNGAVLVGRRPWLHPRLKLASWKSAKGIVRLGGLFLILQLYASASFGSNNIIIAQVLGPASVAQFAIMMRLYGLIPVAVSFTTTPLWPAYSEAFAKGDRSWAWKTLRRSIRLSVSISVLGSLTLLVLANPILDLWVGKGFRADPLLLAAFGSYVVVNAVAASLSAFYNGAGMLKVQVVFGFGSTIGNVVASILLTRALGVSGVLWGSVFAQVFLFLAPILVHLSRVRTQLSDRNPSD